MKGVKKHSRFGAVAISNLVVQEKSSKQENLQRNKESVSNESTTVNDKNNTTLREEQSPLPLDEKEVLASLSLEEEHEALQSCSNKTQSIDSSIKQTYEQVEKIVTSHIGEQEVSRKSILTDVTESVCGMLSDQCTIVQKELFTAMQANHIT